MRRRLLLGFSLVFSPAVVAQQAAFTPYGTGCYDQVQSFYEVFPSGTFDLGNSTGGTSGFSLFPTGTGYAFIPTFSAWRAPVGTGNVTLGDDVVSPSMPLGFTFPYPGGSTSNVWISSNGFLWLQSNTNSWCCNGSASGLLTGGAPRLCPMWMDLYPPGGGSVNFEVDATTQTAYLTFTSVPEFSSQGANTFQLSISAVGVVEFLYQACANISHTVLTGWSRGVNARDGGSIDLSANVPFVTASDLRPLQLTSSSRPIVGSLMPLTTVGIPAGSPIGALLVSLAQYNPGVDLSAVGMPGCTQFAGTDFANVFVPVGGQGTFNWFLPNLSAFAGLRIYCQSATNSAGFNAVGWITSNGAELLIGTF